MNLFSQRDPHKDHSQKMALRSTSVSEWASRLLGNNSSEFKGQIKRYIELISEENADQMCILSTWNPSLECAPTYSQLKWEHIIDLSQHNVSCLKQMEILINERINLFQSAYASNTKLMTAYETLESSFNHSFVHESLQKAYVTFKNFLQLESNYYHQHIYLFDLKKSLIDLQKEASNSIQESQKELQLASRDIDISQRKLAKLRKDICTLCGVDEATGLLIESPEDIGRRMNEKNTALLTKLEKDFSDETRIFLRSVTHRDQLSVSLRRLMHQLDLDSKAMQAHTLSKLAEFEAKHHSYIAASLTCLQEMTAAITVQADVDRYIARNKSSEPDVVALQTQAVSLLIDITSSTPTNISQIINNTLALAEKYQPHESTLSQSPTPSGSAVPSRESSTTSFAVDHDSSDEADPNHSSYFTNVVGGLFNILPRRRVTDSPEPHHSPPLSPVSSPSSVRSLPKIPPKIDDTEAERLFKTNFYLSSYFYSTSLIQDPSIPPVEPVNLTEKMNNRSFSIRSSSVDSNIYDEAKKFLNKLCTTQVGRDLFLTELNQYRSKKVQLDEGFEPLGCLLWDVLQLCMDDNDIKNAKVIMMLSQTFFRMKIPSPSTLNNDSSETVSGSDVVKDEEGDEDSDERRGDEFREYLVTQLLGHPLWQDNTYWEQALWEIVLEQLKTHSFPEWTSLTSQATKNIASSPLGELSTPQSNLSCDNTLESLARCIHRVVFSVILALIHSMTLVQYSRESIRSFIYRSCAIHELSEAQRVQLLQHLYDC